MPAVTSPHHVQQDTPGRFLQASTEPSLCCLRVSGPKPAILSSSPHPQLLCVTLNRWWQEGSSSSLV